VWDDLPVSGVLADLLSRTAATIAGVALLIITTRSLMRTVIVPRALRSAISDTVTQVVVRSCRGLARLRSTYGKRDAVLAWAGPTILLALLITWLVLFLFAYGLLLYGLSGQTLGESLRQAGSSLFTLGFADIDKSDQTIIDFFAAATGPIVIALMIGFLPTIYSSYLHREAAVTALSAAAGEPAWGPEMLSRHTLAGTLDETSAEFARWNELSAMMRMSHTMYPVLIWVRSVRANRHYLVSMIAALDAASLMVSLSASIDRRAAFQLLIQGGQSMEVLYALMARRPRHRMRLPFITRWRGAEHADAAPVEMLSSSNLNILAVEMASDQDAFRGIDPAIVTDIEARENGTITLTRAEFDEAVDLLRRSGFPVDRDADEAWAQFVSARSRYEFAAYALCESLDAPPAPWTGPRRIPTPTIWPYRAVDMLSQASGLMLGGSSGTPRTDDEDSTGHDDGEPGGAT